MLTPLRPNRCVPLHAVTTIYGNDVNVMSPLCSCVAPQTTAVLIQQKQLINKSLNVYSLHKGTRTRLHVKQCKACKLNYVANFNLEINWHCGNDLRNSLPYAHAMHWYSLEQFSFNLVS